MSTARVDWSDTDSVIDYLVDYSRVLAGGRRPFAEAAVRDLVRRDVDRAQLHGDTEPRRNPGGRSSTQPLSSIGAPTLVIHGTADPMFPIEHGEALAEAVPGASLLPLEGVGHGIDRADWEPIVRAILEHTACRRKG